MAGHIIDGKRQLNFSVFTTYEITNQYRRLQQIKDEVKSGDMPLPSYTLIHTNARLSDQDKSEISGWVTSARKQLEDNYPPDSLIKKKK